ncbi:hypothetical protein [Paenibacillus sp. FSL H8-0259]|uniref:hypothetical protein n=1 Tax=Paenibacillus sp. FSL H8-0259 TaxID=1920423 RepID=UPI0015C35B32|nr:hypothetical protein [Paenibacillus sp. FSL H8-0259]
MSKTRSMHRVLLSDVLSNASLEDNVNGEREQEQVPQHLHALRLLQVDLIGVQWILQKREIHFDVNLSFIQTEQRRPIHRFVSPLER